MDQIVGISAAGKLSVALVEGNRLISPVSEYPRPGDEPGDDSSENEFLSMPMEEIVDTVAEMVLTLCRVHNANPVAAGMCFPGIIRDGIVAESPNLKQAKGANLCGMLTAALQARALTPRISVCNDADAAATGIAALRGQLEHLIRVWTLGQGVGFGRYPHSEGPCEGGHIVVSLDPKEAFCGCGGHGHLEGIMGYRAMRLRFPDLEPEEVFANALQGDQRCADFELLWHRALAAASATSIHFDGPGKFFITGANARLSGSTC